MIVICLSNSSRTFPKSFWATTSRSTCVDLRLHEDARVSLTDHLFYPTGGEAVCFCLIRGEAEYSKSRVG